MPFNASGFFQRLFNWRNDRDAGIKILAERMDQEMDGIVAGINDIVSLNVDWKGPMTGVFGTAAAPAYSFQEDPDTGIYRVSSDVLGFSVGGALKLRVSASDVTFDGHAIWHAGNLDQAPFLRSNAADTAEQKITMRKEVFIDRTDNSFVVGSLRTNGAEAILHLVANGNYDNRIEFVARANGDYGALWAGGDHLKWYRDGRVVIDGELSAGSIKWGSQSLDDRYYTKGAADASLVHKQAILPDGHDLNTVIKSGFYRINANLVHAPAGVEWGQMIVSQGGLDGILQIVSSLNSGRIYWRSGHPPETGGIGTWGPWLEFWHSGNLNPTHLPDLTISNDWGALDLRATDPAGNAYLDFTSAGRTHDYDWRMATSNDGWVLNFFCGGELGTGAGWKAGINANGHITTEGYGWLHDYFQQSPSPSTDVNLVDYPIGSTVFVLGSANRNQSVTVRLYATPGPAFILTGSGPALTGTWLMRGCNNAAFMGIAQRVA